MTARLRLPRMLSETSKTEPIHEVEGSDVAGALADVFARVPGLRSHIIDEDGSVRPHVSVFVDGLQANLDTAIADGSEIIVLHAVSGGTVG